MKYDMFVSYRRTDRELVAKIVLKLEERGVGVWYDADAAGGTDFTEEIVTALQGSEMLVIFFSDAANESKHLKRELLVADKLSKPVIPILIEDTEPRGGYLYLLSDRNWIKAFPDPETRVGEIVDLLATLAKKDGGLSGKPGANTGDMKRAEAPARGAAPAPAPQAPTSSAEPELPPLFGDGAAPAPSKKAAPVNAKAYVGRQSALGGKQKDLNDILPFKWIDLLFLVPAVGAFLWFSWSNLRLENETEVAIVMSLFAISIVALYGALVFPFRYYLRRRPVSHALRSYLASSLILFGLAIGPYLIADSVFGMFPYDEPTEILMIFGVAWVVFAVLAFLIYGVLAAQRALRSFRSNVKAIA